MSLRFLVAAALLVAVATQDADWQQRFLAFVKTQEKLVMDLAQFATDRHAGRKSRVGGCECSKHGCSNDWSDAICDERLPTPEFCELQGQRIDNQSSIVRTPSGTYPFHMTASMKESICVYQHLEEFVTGHGYIDDPGWSYVGLRDGTFHRFPGIARRREVEGGDHLLNFCEPYDPRPRPWYVGAITGPKDIVLVVDKSDSMIEPIRQGGQTKWSLAQRAVQDMLGTFSFNDFINVVTFSDGATPLWNASGLVRGESDNINELERLVSLEHPDGQTNFTAAFEAAFGLLSGCDQERSSCECQKIIIFLTDGRDQSGVGGESIRPSSMAKIIEDLQDDLEQETTKRASIFTYSMSDDADDAIPRQIACTNEGAWGFIGPSTNTLDALNSYYLYVAGTRTESPIWVEPYEDASHLGMTTTVAIPFYAPGTDMVPDIFLGVAAHTVTLQELERVSPTLNDALNQLLKRAKCTAQQPTQCSLQIYRNAHDERSQCPDLFPIGERAASRSDGNIAQCYEHEGHYYKRFSDAVTWTEATSRCDEDGGVLVSIEGEDELAFVASMASADGSWIGANRPDPRTPFSWLDFDMDLTENSSFWGVGEPISPSGEDNCVAIDTRGIIGNLGARRCDLELSFVCKYSNDAQCGDGVARIPRRGYFKTPSLDQCSGRQVLSQTQPVRQAEDLSMDQVICQLGDSKLNEEVICCSKTGSDPTWYVWFSIAVGAVFVVLICVAFFFCLRIRPWMDSG